MILPIDEIFEKDILDNLRKINAANNYQNSPSILDGYFLHYVEDLFNGEDNFTFPCLAAQFADDEPAANKANTAAIISRTVVIIGAVDALPRDTVNRRLNSLLYDARCAVSMNRFDETSKATAIEIGGAKFELPKQSDRYAYFQLTLTIKYNEKWSKPL